MSLDSRRRDGRSAGITCREVDETPHGIAGVASHTSEETRPPVAHADLENALSPASGSARTPRVRVDAARMPSERACRRSARPCSTRKTATRTRRCARGEAVERVDKFGDDKADGMIRDLKILCGVYLTHTP